MKHALLCTLMFALTALSNSAVAGDAASLEILGFSKDGKIFAFEEYGVQDGSGFPYANRFYIDTATDTYLPDTPVRVRIDDENTSVATARAQAAERGAKIIDDEELNENRGYTAASNSITELSADPHQFVFLPRPVFPPIDEQIALKLEEIDFPPAKNCFDAERMEGFRLLKLAPDQPGVSTTLNDDKEVPESRGCPTGYMLGAVQTFYPTGGDGVLAVLIAVERQGFEGPDHRWIAITGKL
ncbi:MAG: DUF2259 domain-containing protein [Rhizobiaceae bacterium]|nr:DUF2259 domain-containing protein [Rhizobiaceae bacterium]